MSNFTTELRYICCSLAGVEADELIEGVEGSWNLIFEQFPIFNEEYRKELCVKILNHFLFREIGFETYGLWKNRINTKLKEIMPYYNKLYESELMKYDPLTNINLDINSNENKAGSTGETGDRNQSRTNVNTTKTEQTNNNINSESGNVDNSSVGTSVGNSENSGKNTNRFSDTPQGSLQNIENNNYLTDARIVDENNKSSNNETTSENNFGKSNRTTTDIGTNDIRSGSSNVENDFVFNRVFKNDIMSGVSAETIKGKIGDTSLTTLMVEYRNSLLNIDMMIIDELNPFFMGLWE